MPSFDVVRVEPSGDAVIAGVATPGSMVEVLDAGKPVGKAKANEGGDWALALDRPLPPGTHDLAIRTTSEDQASVATSDQRVAVAVPEKPNEEPLVVLNTPDAASRVIEMPKSKPPEVAQVTPQESAGPLVKGKAGPPRAGESEVPALPPSETSGESPASGAAGTPGASSTAAAKGAPTAEKPGPDLASPGGQAMAKAGSAAAPVVVAEAGSAPAAVIPPPTNEQVAGKEAPTVAVKPPVPHFIPKVVVWNLWTERSFGSTEVPSMPSAFAPTILEPDQDYSLVINLAGLSFSNPQQTVFSKEVSSSFDEWLARNHDVSAADLTVIALVDNDYFQLSEGHVKSFRVDLAKIRQTERESFEVPDSPFAYLHSHNGEAPFNFGLQSFRLRTLSRAGGASIAVSIWADGKPVDELTLTLCIVAPTGGTKASCLPAIPFQASI